MSAINESNYAAMQPEQRYFLEAEKRKRKEGASQFESIQLSKNERLHSLIDDPWADHAALDELPIPIDDGGRAKFLIVGAGIGGIVAAVKLIQNGFTADQIVILDVAGGLGGTWYWNRYPGLHCDTESYIYMPLLEETGYVPKQKYSSHAEIRSYLEQLVERFDLGGRVLFRTRITGLEWNENSKTWTAGLERSYGPKGKEKKKLIVHAEFAILASGVLARPQVPRTPGLAEFGGPMFHTSRWNYGITGGSGNDVFPDLEKLRGTRVGIIGTGATAVQAVPELAKYAKELFVFQRTPSQVGTRGQCDTDPMEWEKKIAAKPGWQRERMNNFAECTSDHPQEEDLVNDEWSKLKAYSAYVGSKSFGTITPDKAQEHIANLVALDAEPNRRSRERVSQVVKDKQTAEKLTAWYPLWCKRPTFSDKYLQAFNEDNVFLVDTDGKGIERVTEKGIISNGQEYPIDVLVLSTGFSSPLTPGNPGTRIDIEIAGRNGRTMTEKWNEQGLSTLHGMFTNGFPNLFFLEVRQGAAAVNHSHALVMMSEHIANIIAQGHQRASEKNKSVTIEVEAAAEEAWGMRIAQNAAFFSAGVICTPSYINLEGEAIRLPPPNDPVEGLKMAKGAIWSTGILDFEKYIKEWRGNGRLEGVEVKVVE
ncbi:hypothetical protein GQ44DRAFT_821410 [Phaeosphaeriaceae sp. PMI808]|nr:hypothetical protein GQ44DRAFT_821410 [Phaeosphaeriaceae sp. PMI808]